MAQNWLDNDGLYRKFGTDKTIATLGGHYKTYGALREIEIKIDLTALTQAEVVQTDQVFFGTGTRVEEVVVMTHTAAVTGTAIDVGLVRTDRTTEIDFDGFLAAFPTASMNVVGEKNTVINGGTGAGAFIGATTIANPGYITASRTDATAFTAGIVYIRIRYYVP